MTPIISWTSSITSFTALTFRFWLVIFLLFLPPKLSRGVVHEALDHVGSHQSHPTEGPMLHHEHRQRGVEVGLLRQLLDGVFTGRGRRRLALLCRDWIY